MRECFRWPTMRQVIYSRVGACRCVKYVSAGLMIAICEDQQNIRARASSGYFGGAVPVLSRRDQPQYPGPAYPVGHERRRVGGHRAGAAGPGVGAGARAAARGMLPPGHRGRDPVPGQGGHPVAGHAGRTSRPGRPCTATRRLAEVRASRADARRSARPVPHRGQAASRSRPQRSSTPSPSRPPRPSARPAAATTRERRSTAANGTSRWTRSGLLLTVLITAAGVQDRDAARPLLWNLRKRAFPSVRLTWADSGYAGKLVTWAKTKISLHPADRQAHRAAQFDRLAPPVGSRYVICQGVRAVSCLIACRCARGPVSHGSEPPLFRSGSAG